METWWLLYSLILVALVAAALLVGVRMGYAMGRGVTPECIMGQADASQDGRDGSDLDTGYADPWEEGQEQAMGLPTRGIETVGGRR